MTSPVTNTKKRPLLYSDGPPNPASSSKQTFDANKGPGIHEDNGQIYASQPIYDRKSTFIAHFHPGAQVFPSSNAGPTLSSTLKRLQAHPAFQDASHRIAAWRRRSSQQTLQSSKVIYTTFSDDDGEKHAGKHLERVLVELDVEGVLVVGRWWGGVMLGPARFEHIANCARQAVRMWLATLGSGDGGPAKKARLAAADDGGQTDSNAQRDDESARARLAKQLTDRDESIVVLRGLLSEKTRGKSGQIDGEGEGMQSSSSSQQQPPSTATSSSPAKKPDYNAMPLARLKQLEKARDATIAFILKQLDKLDEEATATASAEAESIEKAADHAAKEVG
jgi:hypothetical protein